jgi:uncharacterized protein (DUF305 family)
MHTIIGSGRLFLAVVLGAAVTAGPALADGPAPTRAQARYEVKFLKGMIDHHAMAVMTAMLCEDRAVHPELVALCGQIAATQAAEIELMQGWLEDWYGVEYEPRMTKGMQRQADKLAALDGAEFEIAFMTMMIRHHQAAVREGLRCVDRAYHEALVELCEDIIETQAAEIELMSGWLCDWYDICDD